MTVLFFTPQESLRVAVGASNVAAQAYLEGQRVLVTCAAGLNRSGLVSALILHRVFGWSGEACIQKIRKQRKHPRGLQALRNADFTRSLRRLPARPLVGVPSL